MIHTQRLSPNTLLVEISGHFHSQMAKQLALLVFRSNRLGFSTFLFDLNQISLMEEDCYQHLLTIGQGLQNKGGKWSVLGNPPSRENRFIFGTRPEQLPKETWN